MLLTILGENIGFLLAKPQCRTTKYVRFWPFAKVFSRENKPYLKICKICFQKSANVKVFVKTFFGHAKVSALKVFDQFLQL